MRTTVSVVIPCYNIEGFVADAVRSAVEQSHRPSEVICVDDGSTDGTLEVLFELASTYPHLVRVLTGANGGAPAARNRGLNEAQGDYVQFLDADDLLGSNKLIHQLRLAATYGFPGLIVGSHTHESPTGKRRVQEVRPGNPWVRLVESAMGITSANLWNRKAVVAVGGWNEGQTSSQEYELMFRMLVSGVRVAFDNVSNVTIRARHGSISRNDQADLDALFLKERIIRYSSEHENVDAQAMDKMLNAAFRVIRRVYSQYPREAEAVHRRVFPYRFSPDADGYTTRSYVLAYRFTGLRGAEWLKRRVRSRQKVVQ